MPSKNTTVLLLINMERSLNLLTFFLDGQRNIVCWREIFPTADQSLPPALFTSLLLWNVGIFLYFLVELDQHVRQRWWP